ncbi:universal stress protein UspA [Paraburkholderia ginsengiterrae]|uniref:Universal stress protein UspA n=1 Tax=Paraburkholderia ginsengiterrae TaxID=1462993 RepID=A0A1A9N0M1_9BURK|nr:universal stress protein [Paraburkholderia ginsengiterrae]OAJ53510.1 universal stress protein UspA [Paraburkholderia ginsengiterrae]OAJ59062.1 universal stress protein UspA [Paraburkholderia ginsengiterrae]
MSYKTIAVHLDTSANAHPRFEIALRLAKQFDAHLIGAFAVFSPDPRSLHVMAGTAEYYRQHEARRTERRAALERLFHAELRRAGVPGEWVAIDEPASVAIPRAGRCADLIVAGQDNPADPESYVGDFFPENLILSSGRPILLVPYASNERSTGDRVLVAWDGSREATRAVHDALPFMRTAKSTTILAVNGEHGSQRTRIPGADIATVIARHGVHVQVTDIETGPGGSVGEVLLSQVADGGADLLVMGGYGHARWRELVMGGATRTILRSMTVPVLMSH